MVFFVKSSLVMEGVHLKQTYVNSLVGCQWGGKEGKMAVLLLSSPELFQCIKAIKNSHECHVFFCSFLV